MRSNTHGLARCASSPWTARDPLPDLPAVPTVAVTYRGLISTTWYAFVAQQGTPPARATQLLSAIADVLLQPNVVAQLQAPEAMRRIQGMPQGPNEGALARPGLSARRSCVSRSIAHGHLRNHAQSGGNPIISKAR
jgi:hypothetical protein